MFLKYTLLLGEGYLPYGCQKVAWIVNLQLISLFGSLVLKTEVTAEDDEELA